MLNLTSPEDSHLQSSILLHDRNYNQCEFPSEISAKTFHFPTGTCQMFPFESTLAAIEILRYNYLLSLSPDRIEHMK